MSDADRSAVRVYPLVSRVLAQHCLRRATRPETQPRRGTDHIREALKVNTVIIDHADHASLSVHQTSHDRVPSAAGQTVAGWRW